MKGDITREHYAIAEKNGIAGATLRKRVRELKWDINVAIVAKLIPPKERGLRTQKPIFTQEQLKQAAKLGINKDTLYRRVRAGVPPDIACSTQHLSKKRHDWDNEIYALYRGDEFIATGTVYEIAAATKKSVRLIKFYTYNSVKERSSENALKMFYLDRDDEDEDGDEHE